MEVPVIDISAFASGTLFERTSIARDWARAFQTIGFATIVGHGIDDSLMQNFYDAARRFFDLPMDAKKQCSFPGEQQSQGYVPPDMETIGATFGETNPPDLCQSISFARLDWDSQTSDTAFERDKHRQNLWPAQVPGLKEYGLDYFRLAYGVARQLVRINALALDLPEDFFDPFYERMATTLRLVDYPDQHEEPLSGQLRYGAHTDFSCFTLLRQDNAPGGLQVRLADGEWVDVRPTPGALIINAGDTMARWTNDRFRSNIHRVINPPRHLTGSTRRISIVLFTGPHHDTIVECLPSCHGPGHPIKYPPIRAGDYVMQKIRENMPEPLS